MGLSVNNNTPNINIFSLSSTQAPTATAASANNPAAMDAADQIIFGNTGKTFAQLQGQSSFDSPASSTSSASSPTASASSSGAPTASALSGDIQKLLQDGISYFENTAKGLVGKAGGAAENFANGLLGNLGKGVENFADGLVNKAGGAAQSFADGLVQKALGGLESLPGIGSLVKPFESTITNAADGLIGKGVQAGENFLDGLVNKGVSAGESFLGGLVNKGVSALEGAAGGLIGKVGSFLGGLF